MIEIINDDIFNSNCDYIMHQCNALGVMGAGIAYVIKKDISTADFNKYVKLCEIPYPLIKGDYLVFKSISSKRKYINLISQEKYGNNKNICYTDYVAFRNGIRNILHNGYKHQIRKGSSIAIPYKIGCGLANGDWNIILNILEEEYKNMPACNKYILKIYKKDNL